MLIKYIEERAEKLLKENNLFSAPIDLLKFAENLKVNVEAVYLEDDVSGFFVIKEKVPYIRYNSMEIEPRRRFTIAHELGHFILHSKDTSLFIDKVSKVMFRDSQSSTGEQLKEREANAFAAALLMPKDLIWEEASKLSEEHKEDIVSELCKKFNVSEQAMGIRLANLGMLEFGLF